MNQLQLGIKTEAEHRDLINYIKSYQLRTGRFPPSHLIYEKIAKSHLAEDKNYYNKLMRCRL